MKTYIWNFDKDNKIYALKNRQQIIVPPTNATEELYHDRNNTSANIKDKNEIPKDFQITSNFSLSWLTFIAGVW